MCIMFIQIPNAHIILYFSINYKVGFKAMSSDVSFPKVELGPTLDFSGELWIMNDTMNHDYNEQSEYPGLIKGIPHDKRRII